MAHNNPIRVRRYSSIKNRYTWRGSNSDFRISDLPAVAGALGITIPEVVETAKRIEAKELDNEAE